MSGDNRDIVLSVVHDPNNRFHFNRRAALNGCAQSARPIGVANMQARFATATATATEFHDGTLLPMDAVAVRPHLEDDLAELVAAVPATMLGTLVRMVFDRAIAS